MSKLFDTSQWIAFFTKAGLPPGVAANYALIFSDNRIQLDMLMDLSKEHLYDMGIKLIGHVIAILRYAKEFHIQMAKERAIGGAVNSSKVVGRIVGHYTRPSPKQPLVIKEQEVPSGVIKLKRASSVEVPSKRIRKVPPEEEGAYKIKMPLGTTEKTRKILQQQAVLGSKRSVFTRLGESAVSSSTDLKNSPPSSSSSSSVFERLGPSNKTVSDDTPTSTVTSTVIKFGSPLPYQGVLKLGSGKKAIVSHKRIISTPQGRTVLRPSVQIQRNVKVSGLNRINDILQSNKVNVCNKSEGILSRSSAAYKLNIKSRLGIQGDVRNNARTRILSKKSSSVFNRLGK